MSKRPNVSQSIALRAAAAIAADEQYDVDAALPSPELPPEVALNPEKPKGRVGRPAGKRDIAAKQTVYLDAARHDALTKMAGDRGRSVHSLIIEGIDRVIEKPTVKLWE